MRTPAPTADLEAACSYGRGRSQTGPREGHTPGWLLSAFGRFTFSPSPTVLKKTFRNWVGEALGPPARIRTGSVGSANPGAVRKPQQNQILPTKAPSGAGRKRRQSLLILRAGIMAAQTRRASPVKRGPGKGESKRRSGASPEPSPGAFWLLCRHGQSNSPPAGGEIPRA